MLVGTHAFIALGNMLGVKWFAGGATTDVDFAHAGKNISVALPANVQIDVHAALTSFEQGFIPLVQLSGGAGASYKLSGDPEFQIDFLTSAHRGGDGPIVIPNLNVGLQPLRFMEFSLERVTQAVLVDRNGGAVTVSIPAPERYAVHKLLIVGERSGAMRTKANKDLQQAAALFDYLLATQPESLHDAWRDALDRGPDWRKRALEGLIALQRVHPELKLGEMLTGVVT
ncbi:nucleotidyltransferase domain-containing protein [Polaromonas sp. P1(28)-8]|nr:nucleotidyltransferase domain-containing protein [Polaromonas sp. P1(28)-8]